MKAGIRLPLPTIRGFLAYCLIVKGTMLSLDKPTGTQTLDRENPVFAPPFLGVRYSQMVLLDEIIGYINRGALIRDRWQLAPYPGEGDTSFAARSLGLFQERMLSVRSQDLLEPKVAYGFFPVNSAGDELIVWEDDSRRKERLRLPLHRQTPELRIADFFKPEGVADYAAFQITTLGDRISSQTPSLYAGEVRQSFIDLYGLSLAMLEAFNEYWHRRIRYEWGFGFEDGPSLLLVFDHFYRGERYSLTESTLAGSVVELLDAGQIAVHGAGAVLHPELAAVSLVCHHPQAMPATVE